MTAAATLPSRDGSVKIGALIDDYMAAYAGRDSSRTQRLGWWKARLGAVTVERIPPAGFSREW